jgi:hypothetical protein
MGCKILGMLLPGTRDGRRASGSRVGIFDVLGRTGQHLLAKLI